MLSHFIIHILQMGTIFRGPFNLQTLWDVGGNPRSQRKLTQLQGECANSTPTGPEVRIKPGCLALWSNSCATLRYLTPHSGETFSLHLSASAPLNIFTTPKNFPSQPNLSFYGTPIIPRTSIAYALWQVHILRKQTKDMHSIQGVVSPRFHTITISLPNSCNQTF